MADNGIKQQANYNELERKAKRKARADKIKFANDLAEQAQRPVDSKNKHIASLDVFLENQLIQTSMCDMVMEVL